jgi:protein-S-isoprenylcysteine O-methyltransferase Ste14
MTVKRTLAFVYSIIGFLLFNFIFLYFIGFIGNLVVPYSIDSGEPSSLTLAIATDVALIILFGIQHSVMARPRFKQWWTTFVPEPMERSTYVLFSCLAMILLCWYWQPLPQVIWQVNHAVGSTLLLGLFWGGWLFSFFSSFLISHFDLLGVRQAYFYWQEKEYKPVPFKIISVYKYVRHPIMLGTLIGLWATPTMTVGHLLLSTGFTLYIFIGVHFEEKDLRQLYGRVYEDYQRSTWRIIPTFAISSNHDSHKYE